MTAEAIKCEGSRGSNVFTQFGAHQTFAQLFCQNFYQRSPASNVLLTNPEILGTFSAEQNTEVSGGVVDTFAPSFNANNLTLDDVDITQNLDFPSNIQGNISINRGSVAAVTNVREAAAGFRPTVFNNTSIGTFNCAFNNDVEVRGGRIETCNISSTVFARLYDVVCGSFAHSGNVRYITRGVESEAVVLTWGLPPFGTYPAGTVSERVGYNAGGKLYQDNGSTWVAIA